MIYRKATKQDIPQLCQIRKQQLIDEGIPPSIDIDKDLLRFFQDSFQHNTIIEFLAIDNDQIIATGAVCFYDYPPILQTCIHSQLIVVNQSLLICLIY